MYYPKSQITPNLYTNSGEFVYANTKEAYSGYYFKISTGKYFTGKNQDDRPNVELLPLQTVQNIDTPIFQNSQLNYNATTNIYEQINEEYLNITLQSPSITIIPTYNSVLPTKTNYQNGEFRRYFCKKTNEIQYIEIDIPTYNKLVAKDPQILWQLYKPFDLTWHLTGNVADVARINFNAVELASKTKNLPMLGEYLKSNYIKYYI
jgi:hypothetical protein